MFKLPTYEEAMEIVNSCEDDVFIVNRGVINGFDYAMFNYRLASYKDFIDVDDRRLEMRGLTFIKNGDTWDRHAGLHKFFNVSENESTDIELIKDKRVMYISEKLDGSVIMPILLPNGEIVMKSKMSFESDQAKLAQTVVDNHNGVRSAIKACLEDNFMPIMELISPYNQIVLSYDKTELRFIQVRDAEGNYVDVPGKTGRYGVSIAEQLSTYDCTIESIIEHFKDKTEVEGVVIQFSDGQFVKVKTEWYCEMHHLVGYDATRENELIRTILEDRIDDALSMLGP